MAKENVKIFSESVNTATTSVKSLREELKNLKDAMTNVEEGSEEFYKLADRAGEIQHTISEITETVRGASADFGIMLSNSMQAINGIVGGLQVVNGALVTLGVQSEAITKAIAKVAGLLSIGQGIAQIDSAIKAVDRLRVSITGVSKAAQVARAVLQPKVLLALTAAIAALSVIFTKFNQKQAEAEKQAKATAEAIQQKQIKAMEDLSKKMQENLALQQKIYNIQYGGDTVAVLKAQLAYAQANKKALEDEYNAAIDFNNTMAKRTDYTEEENKQLQENKKLFDEYLNKTTAYSKEIDRVQKELEEALILDAAKRNTEAIKNMKELNDTAKQEAESFWTEYINRPKTIPVVIELEVEEEDFDAVANWVQSQFESKRIKLDFDLASGNMDEVAYLQNMISLEESYLSTIQEGTDEWYKQATVIENLKAQLQAVQAQQKKNTAGVQDYMQVATAGTSALANVFSGLANLQDTTTQEGIDKQARYQYMAAVMSTANSIIGAWSSAMALPAPASFILGALQTAAAAAMGAIQIAQVKKSAKEAGANLSGTSASTSSSAVSSLTAPVQYTSDVNSGYISKSISNTKMYVSVTEIDKVSNRVNVAESESKY